MVNLPSLKGDSWMERAWVSAESIWLSANERVTPIGWAILLVASLSIAFSVFRAWSHNRKWTRSRKTIDAHLVEGINAIHAKSGPKAFLDVKKREALKIARQNVREANDLLYRPIRTAIFFGLFLPFAIVLIVLSCDRIIFRRTYPAFLNEKFSDPIDAFSHRFLYAIDQALHALTGIVVNAVDWTVSPIEQNHRNLVLTIFIAICLRLSTLGFVFMGGSNILYLFRVTFNPPKEFKSRYAKFKNDLIQARKRTDIFVIPGRN